MILKPTTGTKPIQDQMGEKNVAHDNLGFMESFKKVLESVV